MKKNLILLGMLFVIVSCNRVEQNDQSKTVDTVFIGSASPNSKVYTITLKDVKNNEIRYFFDSTEVIVKAELGDLNYPIKIVPVAGLVINVVEKDSNIYSIKRTEAKNKMNFFVDFGMGNAVICYRHYADSTRTQTIQRIVPCKGEMEFGSLGNIE